MLRVFRFISLFIAAIFMLSASTTFSSSKANSFDIAGIYEKVDLKSGSKALIHMETTKYEFVFR